MYPACADCGMILQLNEFHPDAACTIYRATKSTSLVRKTVSSIYNESLELCAQTCEMLREEDSLEDIANTFRALKNEELPSIPSLVD